MKKLLFMSLLILSSLSPVLQATEPPTAGEPPFTTEPPTAGDPPFTTEPPTAGEPPCDPPSAEPPVLP